MRAGVGGVEGDDSIEGENDGERRMGDGEGEGRGDEKEGNSRISSESSMSFSASRIGSMEESYPESSIDVLRGTWGGAGA